MSKIFGTLPWTKSCFVCGEENPHGLHLRSRYEDGCVRLDYETREEDVGYRHIVHGGIAMTLLDEVMTWAAIIEQGKICVAAELETRLKKPIEVGTSLRVEAWVSNSAKRICYTRGAISDASGVELLAAEGKYMPMPANDVELCEKDFVTSPDSIHPSKLMQAR